MIGGNLIKVINKLKNQIKNKPLLKEILVRLYGPFKILKTEPSKLALIKKFWQKRASFVANINNYELNSDEENLLHSQCYFVAGLFKSLGLKRLSDLVVSKKYRRLALIGENYHKKKLFRSLRKEFPELVIECFSDPGTVIQPLDSSIFDAVILTASNESAISLTRTILNTLKFKGDLIVDGNREHRVAANKIESTKPIVVCAYPCAGTNRFIFGFEYLMNKLMWKQIAFSPFVRNVRYIHTLNNRVKKTPDNDLVDNAFYWKIQTLDYFQWLNTHEYFSLSKTKDLDCRFVVLMRDPRDIINSFYWHTINEVSDKDNHIHRIIDGYSRFAGANYALNWPSASKMVGNYLTAIESRNCCIIRFEDLHQNEVGSFRKLMKELKLYPHYLAGLYEKDLKKAAYLGSFECQTKGRYKRGLDRSGRPGGEYSGISCRKGTVGDWRSSFTKKAVDHFKALTGDGLIKLGYEKKSDWEL